MNVTLTEERGRETEGKRMKGKKNYLDVLLIVAFWKSLVSYLFLDRLSSFYRTEATSFVSSC